MGEVGIGKTTFLRTLFQKYASPKLSSSSPPHSVSNGPTRVIDELGHFTVNSAGDTASYIFHLIDTPGFGDNLNHQVEIDAVKSYILAKHQAWLSLDPLLEEHERLASDERVHCGRFYMCFMFICCLLVHMGVSYSSLILL